MSSAFARKAFQALLGIAGGACIAHRAMCAVLLRVSVPALLIYHVDERQPRGVPPDVLREDGHLALRRTLVLVEHCRKDSSAFAELLDNGFGQVLMNLIVTGNRLRPLRF